MNELYELKKTVKGAKILLNILWGALCETNHLTFNPKIEDKISINNTKITRFCHNFTNVKIKSISYESKYYKTNWARIKPWVISYGRKVFYYKYKRYEDDIIRINTDGFYITKQPKDILTGEKLGNLKYEGVNKIKLTGLNSGLKIK